MIKEILQYIAILTFFGLSLVSLSQKDWNSVCLNACLMVFYIFLYLQPFGK